MKTFEIVIITSALCGLVMIIGGILLLYKGIIRLNEVSAEEAIKVEFQKIIKVSSRYPALGLFIIGLIFMIIAIWNSKPQAVEPIEITGRLPIQNPHSATINISSADWTITPSSDSIITGTIFPNFCNLKVEVVMPGYDPPNVTLQYSIDRLETNRLNLNNIPIGVCRVRRSDLNTGIIRTAAVNIPRTEQGSFK